jgi:hypothetical protein
MVSGCMRASLTAPIGSIDVREPSFVRGNLDWKKDGEVGLPTDPDATESVGEVLRDGTSWEAGGLPQLSVELCRRRRNGVMKLGSR